MWGRPLHLYATGNEVPIPQDTGYNWFSVRRVAGVLAGRVDPGPSVLFNNARQDPWLTGQEEMPPGSGRSGVNGYGLAGKGHSRQAELKLTHRRCLPNAVRQVACGAWFSAGLSAASLKWCTT